MLSPRPPIVVILGHVDHGKTTLLDCLRRTEIAAGEAGGITQHIRSFILSRQDKPPITFIDTPGHEAFSAMRRRGSRLADLALLVVAADDGVMPQTRQSIAFIRETGIPFIVVITKIDLAAADPDRVRTQLAGDGVLVEGFGGQVPSLGLSAKTGRGIPELLEMIDLVTSLDSPTANVSLGPELVVLESRLDSRKGPLAVVLVKNGTLTVGQSLFQHRPVGKVKALISPDGENMTLALPSQPVEILGLTLVPEVGSVISHQSVSAPDASKHPGLETTKPSSGFNFIIKADMAGSLEAILAGLDPEAGVISSGTGNITENDVALARTSGARILAFNVKLPGSVAKLAETEKVDISSFTIIYQLFAHVIDLLHPKSTEQIIGQGKILADFKINSDRIAGCHCLEGYFDCHATVKIIRQNQPVGSVRIKSLHQGKNIVEKVKTGTEFGAVFSPYIDFQVGDDIIATIG